MDFVLEKRKIFIIHGLLLTIWIKKKLGHIGQIQAVIH